LVASDVTYRVLENNLIVITPKAMYQQNRVTGVVTDASTGELLPGVYVRVEGTNTGAVTGADGSFAVDIAGPSSVLLFSFVGYQPQSITVGSVNHAKNIGTNIHEKIPCTNQ